MPLSCNMGYTSIKMAKMTKCFQTFRNKYGVPFSLKKNPRWFTQVAVKPKRWMFPLLIKYFIHDILLVKRGDESSRQVI